VHGRGRGGKARHVTDEAGLDRIAALKSVKELPALIAHLQLETGSSGFFFGFGSNPDFQDSSQVIAFATSGDWGSRSRLLREGRRASRARSARSITRMSCARSRSWATSPMWRARTPLPCSRSRMRLARATLTNVEQRDPYNLYHRIDRAALLKTDARVRVGGLPEAARAHQLKTFNVTEPKFFAELDKQLSTRRIEEVRTYLRWHYTRASSAFLSRAFVDASFDFYRRR
jgi:endothelin-converting enzyme/putative endopeptidase